VLVQGRPQAAPGHDPTADQPQTEGLIGKGRMSPANVAEREPQLNSTSSAAEIQAARPATVCDQPDQSVCSDLLDISLKQPVPTFAILGSAVVSRYLP
jgi:hypothetical protein